jgi:hypothetical protein
VVSAQATRLVQRFSISAGGEMRTEETKYVVDNDKRHTRRKFAASKIAKRNIGAVEW